MGVVSCINFKANFISGCINESDLKITSKPKTVTPPFAHFLVSTKTELIILKGNIYWTYNRCTCEVSESTAHSDC